MVKVGKFNQDINRYIDGTAFVSGISGLFDTQDLSDLLLCQIVVFS